ncbi:hypothetical protein ABMA28_015103 [Loxostege sticticalis]|uniref:Gem-associated protein 7 n=1 Tax=Loxostege sticticalis TaxID=481309 RepID=A0ABD0TEC4_LOXSC
MPSDLEAKSTETNEQQEVRAKLREIFLRAVSELHGEPVNILTYESTTLNATFSGWKPDGSEVLVKDMTTPACVKMPAAILRTPDILAIEFTRPVQLP